MVKNLIIMFIIKIIIIIVIIFYVLNGQKSKSSNLALAPCQSNDSNKLFNNFIVQFSLYQLISVKLHMYDCITITIHYLRATLYFRPSFSISPITQSVMQGVPGNGK